MKLFKNVGLTLAAFFFVSITQAGTIVDTIEQDEYVSFLHSYSYQHNINDDGFVLGTALSGNLSVEIYDDNNDFFNIVEIQLVIVEAFDFDTGGISFGDFESELELQALGALNADGFLDVKIVSLLGDFYVGDSVLTVETAAEPSTIALLGLGIAGVGLARRKKLV